MPLRIVVSSLVSRLSSHLSSLISSFLFSHFWKRVKRHGHETRPTFNIPSLHSTTQPCSSCSSRPPRAPPPPSHLLDFKLACFAASRVCIVRPKHAVPTSTDQQQRAFSPRAPSATRVGSTSRQTPQHAGTLQLRRGRRNQSISDQGQGAFQERTETEPSVSREGTTILGRRKGPTPTTARAAHACPKPAKRPSTSLHQRQGSVATHTTQLPSLVPIRPPCQPAWPATGLPLPQSDEALAWLAAALLWPCFGPARRSPLPFHAGTTWKPSEPPSPVFATSSRLSLDRFRLGAPNRPTVQEERNEKTSRKGQGQRHHHCRPTPTA